MCTVPLNIFTFFFFFLDGEIRAEVEDTIFLSWENISWILHNNFYLQSYTLILRRELLRFVQKTKDISVLFCESIAAPWSYRNPVTVDVMLGKAEIRRSLVSRDDTDPPKPHCGKNPLF